MEGLSLDLTQAAKSIEVRKHLDFVITGWLEIKTGWLDELNVEQEMKNVACGDNWFLLVVAWLVLVENEEISY